jgi:hypothetical protein
MDKLEKEWEELDIAEENPDSFWIKSQTLDHPKMRLEW